MTPEERQQFEQLKDQVRRLDAGFRNLAQIDPQFRTVVRDIVYSTSSANPLNYDKSVDENGMATYTVADKFDGFIEIEGNRIVGYYNI